jgi:hypothetical protein
VRKRRGFTVCHSQLELTVTGILDRYKDSNHDHHLNKDSKHDRSQTGIDSDSPRGKVGSKRSPLPVHHAKIQNTTTTVKWIHSHCHCQTATTVKISNKTGIYRRSVLAPYRRRRRTHNATTQKSKIIVDWVGPLFGRSKGRSCQRTLGTYSPVLTLWNDSNDRLVVGLLVLPLCNKIGNGPSSPPPRCVSCSVAPEPLASFRLCRNVEEADRAYS